MLIVLASLHDADAAAFAARFRERGVRLLTCAGLSRRGWRYEPTAPERSFAVLDEGEPVPVTSIRGVLTRLSAVSEVELPHILPDERAYVASEMMAFLLAWLGSMRCPVLNRPTPLGLSGPSWHREQWCVAAERAGLAIAPVHRLAPRYERGAVAVAGAAGPALTSTLMVVGERVFAVPRESPIDRELADGAVRLTSMVDAPLATLSFEGSRFAAATAWVDLAREDVAKAVLERLEAGS